MKKIIKNLQAFSLLEIMVAFSILVLVFVSLAQSFPLGISVSSQGEKSTVASYLCQEKIEELTASGYDSISTGVLEAKHRLSDDSSAYLYQYKRKTEAYFVDSDLNVSAVDTGLKKISVSVYYVNPIYKKEKEFNITTLVSQR